MKKLILNLAFFVFSGTVMAQWHIAQSNQIEQYRYLSGEIEAVNKATVSSQISARVKTFFFDVDDYVQKGETIVEFTNEEQNAILAKAKAIQESVSLALKQAEIDLHRTKEIYQNKLISRNQLDQYRLKRDALKAQVKAAIAAVLRAENELSYTKITAPYNGIMTKRFVEIGEMVSPGKPIIEGLNLINLRVVTQIPESIITLVKEKPIATVLMNDKALRTKGITIFPYANRQSRSFKARIEIESDGKLIFPGMTVKVGFKTGEASVLTIPKSAVIHKSELTLVYVKYQEAKLLRHIKLGKTYGDFIEVLSGLNVGELVFDNSHSISNPKPVLN